MRVRYAVYHVVAIATVLFSAVAGDAKPIEKLNPGRLFDDPKPRFERSPEKKPELGPKPADAPRNDYSGPRSMIIELDASKIHKRVDKMRSRRRIQEDDRGIRRYKSRQFAKLAQSFAESAKTYDVKIERAFKHLPIVAVHVQDEKQIERLERVGGVVAVHENFEFVPFLAESLPQVGQPAAAFEGATGRGTSVAVLDTGVDFTDPAFGSCTSPGQPAGCRVAFAAEFALPDGSLDDDGHGTNVAGIVLGTAPETNILALDVFEMLPSGPVTNVVGIAAAIDFLIGTKFLFNTVAMNLSLGTDGMGARGRCISPVDSVFAEAQAVGIMPIVASGNDSEANLISVPACSPFAVSVGAVTERDAVAEFSNSGTSLDLLAPGTDITAAGLTLGGTSMAAPHVAGAFAAVTSFRGDLGQYQVLQALKDTGVPITDLRQGRVTPRIQLDGAIFWSPVLVLPAPLANYRQVSPIEWAWAECQMEEIVDGFECGWDTVICGIKNITDAAICGVEEILFHPWDILSGMSCSCSNVWCTCEVAATCPVSDSCDIPDTCDTPDTCPFERDCDPAAETCDPQSCEVEVCAF